MHALGLLCSIPLIHSYAAQLLAKLVPFAESSERIAFSLRFVGKSGALPADEERVVEIQVGAGLVTVGAFKQLSLSTDGWGAGNDLYPLQIIIRIRAATRSCISEVQNPLFVADLEIKLYDTIRRPGNLGLKWPLETSLFTQPVNIQTAHVAYCVLVFEIPAAASLSAHRSSYLSKKPAKFAEIAASSDNDGYISDLLNIKVIQKYFNANVRLTCKANISPVT